MNGIYGINTYCLTSVYCVHYSVLNAKSNFELNRRICSYCKVTEMTKYDHGVMTRYLQTILNHPREEFVYQ